LLFTESRTKIIEFLKKNNKKYNIIEIEGHTDNTGSISKNYQLSKSRIEAVKIFITEKLGISSNKILLKAHGEYDANLETNKETADISHRKVVILLYKTKPEEQSTIKK
jgi:outer membrane protein OmpA-like peptidoglycan-associated protein